MSARRSRIVLAASLIAFLSPVFLPGQTFEEFRVKLEEMRPQLPAPEPHPALTQARLLADADQIPPEQLEEIHRLYAQAIEESTGAPKLEAYNSYGVFLLRQGDAAKAAAVLLQGTKEAESADAATRSRLLYNYGIALERSDRAEEAEPVYFQSFELDPGFMPACEAAFRSSSDLRVPVVERLLERGYLESARDYLQTSFKKTDLNGYPELTMLWARYLTAARIGPGQDYRPPLNKRNWLDDETQGRLALIDKAYDGELPLLLDPAEGRAFTRRWQEPEDAARAFSELLQMIGDELVKQGRPREAVSRYALAWSCAGNLDAATRLVGLLRSARAEVDPQHEVLGKLMTVFFEGTGASHLPAGDPRVVRFHTALGLLLEGEEHGSSADGPRSAVYQWERALAAQEALPGIQSAPGLNSHLATAYKQAGRTDEALTQFLNASLLYASAGRTEAAETQLFRAAELAKGDETQTERLDWTRQYIALKKADGTTIYRNNMQASDFWLFRTEVPSDVLRDIEKQSIKDPFPPFPDLTGIECEDDPPR